jgi:hypothetical protein
MTRREWYDFPRIGPCEVCGKRGRRQAHHVVREQDVKRAAPARRWDLMNRMLVGAFCCHYAHTQFGVNDTRIPYAKVSESAKKFADEVLGEGAAINFWRRYYANAP